MYSNVFAICDSDEKYLRKIQEYLIKKRISRFEIQVFTNLENAISKSEEEPFEVLLVDENLYNDNIRKVRTNNLFILLENETGNFEYPVISKYQSTDDLIKTLFGEISDSKSIQKNSNEKTDIKYGKTNTQLITYYTPLNKDEQTWYSIDRAINDSGSGMKVLYMDLTPFSDIEYYIGIKNDSDVTDFIYYVLSNCDNLFYKLEGIKSVYKGVDILTETTDFMDILNIKEEEWMKVIDALMYIGNYDEVIINAAENCHALYKILEKSDEVITIIKDDNKNAKTVGQYRMLLEKRQLLTVLDKTSFIKVGVN